MDFMTNSGASGGTSAEHDASLLGVRSALDDAFTSAWTFLRVLADLAEEEGGLVLAVGYRWLADNKKAPYAAIGPDYAGGAVFWAWSLHDGETKPCRMSYDLPMRLFRMKGILRCHPTPHEAYRAAAESVGAWLSREETRTTEEEEENPFEYDPISERDDADFDVDSVGPVG